MSRHLCQCTTRSGRAVRVVAGHDRATGGVFLQVHDILDEGNADAGEEDGDAVYFFSPGRWTSVASIADALEQLGIAVPATFIAGIDEDQRENAGNRIVRHRVDGEPTVVHGG